MGARDFPSLSGSASPAAPTPRAKARTRTAGKAPASAHLTRLELQAELNRQYERYRDAFILRIIKRSKHLSQGLVTFFIALVDDFERCIEHSDRRYHVKLGGRKGNITLVTSDGQYKVERQMQTKLVFNESLQSAKALIDQCIEDWGEHSDPRLLALIRHAFRVDRKGKIRTDLVLGLRRLSLTDPAWHNDPKWQEAMRAIADSIVPVNTKTYFRFYERDVSGAWRAITLDLAYA